MIEVSHLSKAFDGKQVLRDLSLLIHPNEILFILGKSGTGKSVLLKHVVGLLNPDEGSVIVEGVELNRLSEHDLFPIRKKCGMVFQYPALLDSLSVVENVAFGIRSQDVAALHKNEEAIRSRVTQLLQQVGLSAVLLDRMPNTLSLSVQKRVSIARTLATVPQYLLVDEPTTGMDPVITNLLCSLLLRLKRELQLGCVVVSHDIQSALKIADRIVLMDAGRVSFDGTTLEFKSTHVPLAIHFLKEALS